MDSPASKQPQQPLFPPKTKVEDRTLQSQLGTGKAGAVCPIMNLISEQTILDDKKLKDTETLYIRGCKDCNFTVTTKCVKIMIEGCTNCQVTLNGVVITSIVELWKCDDFSLNVNAKVLTLQVDICKKLSVKYARKEDYQSLIWCGVYGLDLSFADDDQKMLQGFDEMKQQPAYSDINDTTDQFIVRFVDQQLIAEQVVRLANGYPTTEREAKAFDEEAKRNAEATEAYVRKLVDFGGARLGLKALQKKRVARNGPCSCGSGQKYKKCCGDPKKKTESKEEKPEKKGQ